MRERHLTIKATLSRIGKDRYRCRLEQSPAGASAGQGHDFRLTKQQQDEVRAFRRKLASGGFAGRKEIETFGRFLSDLALGGEVRTRFGQCVALARERNAELRIALTTLTDELIGLPWEYLHDGAGFLIDGACSIVRVVDEIPERPAPFEPIRRLLVALANPRDSDLSPFDAAGHRSELEARIARIGGLDPTVLHPATRSGLREAIREGDFDAIYFVGHGRFSGNLGGQLLLESEDGGPDPLDAVELAGWVRAAASVRLVYLNSCSSAETGADNPFAGVAQRLLRDGEVAGVVAMQAQVLQQPALNMAEAFFTEIRRGASPERAVSLSRRAAGDLHSWGVPVVYTFLSGPEELERNRIATLLGAERGKSRYALLLPTFFQGVSAEDRHKVHVTFTPPETYRYPGESFALMDLMGAWDVLTLLEEIASHDQIRIVPDEWHERLEESHWFLFGSRSNRVVAAILKGYSPRFRFHYSPTEWALEDLEHGEKYVLPAPDKPDSAYLENRDFGVIEKVVEEAPSGRRRVFFLLSGLGDRATRGCAWYLVRHWEDLLARFGGSAFRLVLEFPEGLGFNHAREMTPVAGE